MLRATGTEMQLYFCPSGGGLPFTSTYLSEEQLALGWLWTSGVTNLICWPAMYYLRKLPGFREVL